MSPQTGSSDEQQSVLIEVISEEKGPKAIQRLHVLSLPGPVLRPVLHGSERQPRPLVRQQQKQQC